MALLPWQTGKIIRIQQETPNTRRYWMQVEGLSSFDFLAGQFVTLDLPIHEKPNKRWRSYSIASGPDGTNIFELVIVLTPQGAGSTWIFENIHEGSELKFRGPLGNFVLPPALDKDLLLICTGTGIAPYRSMLYTIRKQNIPHRKIYLVFGTRTEADILYYEEMKELASKLDDFEYIPVLSRQDWSGRKGYVHSVYEDLCRQRQPAYFYLCGWRNMIDEARERIVAMGYERKEVHLELYG